MGRKISRVYAFPFEEIYWKCSEDEFTKRHFFKIFKPKLENIYYSKGKAYFCLRIQWSNLISA